MPAPRIAIFRAGSASASGVNAMQMPPPAAIAEPPNTNGSLPWNSCHDGTAVLASSTAV